METLKVRPVSKAQARQRCGRAGRECPGICYRLYPEQAFQQLDENTVPEIKRCNLRSLSFCFFVVFFLIVRNPNRQNCRKTNEEECIFVYIALHIECRFIKTTLLHSTF